jgi:hypothetical protein
MFLLKYIAESLCFTFIVGIPMVSLFSWVNSEFRSIKMTNMNSHLMSCHSLDK